MSTQELVFTLIACVGAVVLGVLLAKKQARAYSATHISGLPGVTFADYGDMRFLHLSSPAVQGSMRLSQPFDIHLDYVQRMMAWLLFVNLHTVHQLRAMQMGLGAAALTKFCYHHLRMQTTVVEINPQVVDTCRQWFQLPHDDDRLNIVLASADDADILTQWRAKIDALQVDLYDQEASHPVIDTEAFYSHCRQLLTPQGCMSVNLFGKDLSYPASLQKIKAVFGADAVWEFKPTTAGNTIVLAFHTPPACTADAMQANAQVIESRWALPASKWLKVLSPITAATKLTSA